jgi:protein-tyrosine-phosphatase
MHWQFGPEPNGRGLLRQDAGDQFEVFSAGTKTSQVRSEAIAAMEEVGIDISGQCSKSVDGFAGHQFDYILTANDSTVSDTRIQTL